MARRGKGDTSGLYGRIYDYVRRVPPGRVVTYGQVAAAVGGCTARTVGYAMAATPFWEEVPWQRVVNSRGEVSARRHGDGDRQQQRLLESEGVVFDARGGIDLRRYRWEEPDG
ncbi:MAG: cysteine methyltransferase [Candidatus Eisenbacteria bacterium]|nr:cysteine methyltransferase [Candidatus Eisenbacteria bacterium]